MVVLLLNGGDPEVDWTVLILSVSNSFYNAGRFYLVLKDTANAYQEPILCGRRLGIVGELMNIGDPECSHIPYHLLLRTKAAIDFAGCGELSVAHCRELGEAVSDNKTLQELTFRSENAITATCYKEIGQALGQSTVLHTVIICTSPNCNRDSDRFWLDDAQCAGIAKGLMGNRVLHTLKIQGIRVCKPDTVTRFAEMLKALPSLETFHLEGQVRGLGRQKQQLERDLELAKARYIMAMQKVQVQKRSVVDKGDYDTIESLEIKVHEAINHKLSELSGSSSLTGDGEKNSLGYQNRLWKFATEPRHDWEVQKDHKGGASITMKANEKKKVHVHVHGLQACRAARMDWKRAKDALHAEVDELSEFRKFTLPKLCRVWEDLGRAVSRHALLCNLELRVDLPKQFRNEDTGSRFIRRLASNATLRRVHLKMPINEGMADAIKLWLQGRGPTGRKNAHCKLRQIALHTDALTGNTLPNIAKGMVMSPVDCIAVTYDQEPPDEENFPESVDKFFEIARDSKRLQLAVVAKHGSGTSRNTTILDSIGRIRTILGSAYNSTFFGRTFGKVVWSHPETVLQAAVDETAESDDIPALLELLRLVRLDVEFTAVVMNNLKCGDQAVKAVLNYVDKQQSKLEISWWNRVNVLVSLSTRFEPGSMCSLILLLTVQFLVGSGIHFFGWVAFGEVDPLQLFSILLAGSGMLFLVVTIGLVLSTWGLLKTPTQLSLAFANIFAAFLSVGTGGLGLLATASDRERWFAVGVGKVLVATRGSAIAMIGVGVLVAGIWQSLSDWSDAWEDVLEEEGKACKWAREALGRLLRYVCLVIGRLSMVLVFAFSMVAAATNIHQSVDEYGVCPPRHTEGASIVVHRIR